MKPDNALNAVKIVFVVCPHKFAHNANRTLYYIKDNAINARPLVKSVKIILIFVHNV